MVMPFNTYTFANAPQPRIIVSPAQGSPSQAQKSWLLANAKTADVTMSVCTGASRRAHWRRPDQANRKPCNAGGLRLAGWKSSHHPSPIRARAAAALSGSTLHQRDAVCRERQDFNRCRTYLGHQSRLHVAERYYGRAVAQATAGYMEYHGALWKNPELATLETEAAASRSPYHRVGCLPAKPGHLQSA